MKIYIWVLILILLIFISGCEDVVCNKPYIRFQESCCLDYNSNKICDIDEKIENKLASNQIKLFVGEAKECDGKLVKLISMGEYDAYTIKVEGISKEVFSSRGDIYTINGLKLMTLNKVKNFNNPENYILLACRNVDNSDGTERSVEVTQETISSEIQETISEDISGCGNGICESNENQTNCIKDCPIICVNSTCIYCGDGICGRNERCPRDCPPSCGDGICDFEKNECFYCEKIGDCSILVDGMLWAKYLGGSKYLGETCKPVSVYDEYLPYFYNPTHPEIEKMSQEVLSKRKWWLDNAEYNTIEYLDFAHEAVIDRLRYDYDRGSPNRSDEAAITLDDTLRLNSGQCDNFDYVLISLFQNIINKKPLGINYELKSFVVDSKNEDVAAHYIIVLELGNSADNSIQRIYDSTSEESWVFETKEEKSEGWENLILDRNYDNRGSLVTIDRNCDGPYYPPNLWLGNDCKK